jgi:two-component system NarL family sensor kinase
MTANTRLESDTEKLQQRNRELSILNSIAEALNRTVELDQALRTALAKVAELLGLQTGWVWLLHEELGESYLAAGRTCPSAGEQSKANGVSCHCLDTYQLALMEPQTSMS